MCFCRHTRQKFLPVETSNAVAVEDYCTRLVWRLRFRPLKHRKDKISILLPQKF
jgi:hypothetical protein